MDPEYVDEEEEAAAMAAMMGFSGFGSQKPPAKKRKFNANTDAFVEGQELESIDKGGKKGQGSGGNTIPLGKTRVFGTGSENKATYSPAINDSEIDLGDEDDADGPQYVDTSLPPPILADEEGPRYVDTSLPPPILATDEAPAVSEEEASEMQSRIDAILASIEPKEPMPEPIPPAPGTAPHGLPQRPNFNTPNIMNDSDFMRGGARQGNPRDAFSDTTSISSSRPSHRGGPRNENWYLDYYDPGFIENPWARLEKEKGLEPLGKWPEVQGGRKSK